MLLKVEECDGARLIADETLFYIKAARDNELKALERYHVGLTEIVEVAESERILARAEVDAAVAEVRVWQAILDTMPRETSAPS